MWQRIHVILAFLLLSRSDKSQAYFLFAPSTSASVISSSNPNECSGSCQWALTCWLAGGHSDSSQGCQFGLYTCCIPSNISSREAQRPISYAQPRKLDFWDNLETNSIEIFQNIHYGPVKNDPICGLQRIGQRRIVGGRSAGFGVYPWQALVLNQNSRCGGALVSREHVVTAGHCVTNYTDPHKVTQFNSEPVL